MKFNRQNINVNYLRSFAVRLKVRFGGIGGGSFIDKLNVSTSSNHLGRELRWVEKFAKNLWIAIFRDARSVTSPLLQRR